MRAIITTFVDRLEKIFSLNPPTKASAFAHVVVTWLMMLVASFARRALILAIETVALSNILPPSFDGLGIFRFGLCLECLITVIAMTQLRRFFGYLIPLVHGYWLCTVIWALTTFFQYMFMDKGWILKVNG